MGIATFAGGFAANNRQAYCGNKNFINALRRGSTHTGVLWLSAFLIINTKYKLMRRRKKTYISMYQIKKYGFIINKRRQTDLEAFIINDKLSIRLFNYDYYTVLPDSILMIDINGDRVFEGRCKNRQMFKKIMKRLGITPHTFSYKFTTLYNYDIVKNGDYVRFLSSDGEYINCQVKERICDNIHCETGKVMKKGSLYIHNQFFDIKDYRNAELQPF